MSIGIPSTIESGPNDAVPPAKLPVHSTETVNVSPSSAGVAATPVTSLARVRVAVFSVFSNPTGDARGVVNSIPSLPTSVGAMRLLIVQPGAKLSVTVHVEPGGTSGRFAASAMPMPPLVRIDVDVLTISTPSKVQTIAKLKLPSTSSTSALEVVLFWNSILEVVLVKGTTSPSESIVIVLGEPVAVNRGSACSVTVHSEPVGRSSITSGAFAVTV